MRDSGAAGEPSWVILTSLTHTRQIGGATGGPFKALRAGLTTHERDTGTQTRSHFDGF